MQRKVLESLGLTQTEEDVYRTLVRSGAVGHGEVAREAGLDPDVAMQALEGLAELGLVSRSPGPAPRFVPAPPGVALEALVVARQEGLNRARLAAQELEHDFRRSVHRTAPADLVEVVVGRRAVADRVHQLELTCEKEILHLSKPPYASPPGRHRTLLRAIDRGVRVRTVYDKTALEQSGVLEEIDLLEREGGGPRVHPSLPMKILIGDRRMALLPLWLEEPDQLEGALFVRPSALLEALVLLWEAYWERALPTTPPRLDDVSGDQDGRVLSEEDSELTTFLLAGLTVGSIARRLGMSPSSVERRIRRLLRRLGAETRFQAGFLVSERGLRGPSI
jgi:sugar-specific transcriptional regulator TrmB/DNA-binding CsgD family transcriptional regulator